MYGQKKKMITGSLKVALGDCFSCKGLNSLLDTPFCPTNYRYLYRYLCKLSLLLLSFTIPHKQPHSLSGGVLLPPLKSPWQKPCIPPSKTINYDHSNCRHVVSFWYTIVLKKDY